MQKPLPHTLIEAIVFFSDLNVCNEFVAALRWPDGPVCDRCGSVDSYLTTRRLWKCKGCKRQYSVKVGTIFEDRPCGSRSGSRPSGGRELEERHFVGGGGGADLGVTQKSAWFMLHRIRLAMKAGSFFKMTGAIEADETYVGGTAKNMHAADRKRRGIKQGPGDQAIVIGALERGGEVRAEVVADNTGATLQGFVRENVAHGSVVNTDAARGYIGLRDDYDHGSTDHGLGEYVRGEIHTNGIENFWAPLSGPSRAPTFRWHRSTWSVTWTSACSPSTTAICPTCCASTWRSATLAVAALPTRN